MECAREVNVNVIKIILEMIVLKKFVSEDVQEMVYVIKENVNVILDFQESIAV